MKKLLFILSLLSYSISNAQIVNIPDANFKNALLNHSPVIDTNGDGEIQVSEATAFTGNLYVPYNNISDLSGIEHFTNLTALNCSYNQLSSLDISNNTNLTELNCSGNQLSSLDVSNNTNLTYLSCSYNYLSSLDVSNNTNLTQLACDSNQLSSLDVSNNTNLTELNCWNNHLSSLDVSNNTNLTVLNCYNNQLSSLDVSNNTNLTDLVCSSNQLSSLDVSNNTNLSKLVCSSNQLSSLDVSNITNLTTLRCYNNQLSSLYISNNTNLTSLSCYNNHLSSLDVSNSTNLTSLYCFNNHLSSLYISNNTNLTSLSCYNNQLSSLDVSNNTNLTELYCWNNHLSSLDISNNPLNYLNCGSNQLSSLDVSNNTNLTDLYCWNNHLSSLDVSNNTNLTVLNCYNNQLSSLDVSNNTNLTDLVCSSNQLSSLDVSNNTNLVFLSCNDNANLTYINLKNGNNNNFDTSYSDFGNLPNLQTVCVDELNTYLTAFIVSETGHPVTFTEYCSFEPAQSNTINGTVNIDLDNNGCDTNDVSLNNVLITADNGNESFGTFVLPDATYAMFTNEGDFTTAVTTNLPNYWSVTPTEYTNTFTGFDNTFTADFCITPNQTVNDVTITLIPTSQARPGFVASYQIVYKNVGTTQLNGNITLEFDETKLNFLSASEAVNTQTSNSLTFDYAALNPFETRSINLAFNVNSPTDTQPVTIGNTLAFTATINPITGDYTAEDNVYNLNQNVVGSYDPNDITCLEGNQILLADADKYLHYVIRFQNTGTASAINVVVKNILDANLDWSTIQLESSSYDNRVAIKNGNEIEFIFENINLPDSTTDEPNSHGFIAYKIKPKSDVVVGDVISNKADIFFDYNVPVETNTATTTIVNVLNVNENTLLDFSVYPIPTDNLLQIKSKSEIAKIEIFGKLGRLIQQSTNNNVDVSNLTQGLYFVKVTDVNNNFGVKKFVKK